MRHTSETTRPAPPLVSSTAMSSRAQNICWWCWAFTPGATRVPNSGSDSPWLSWLVLSSPVSLISYSIVPSCWKYQLNRYLHYHALQHLSICFFMGFYKVKQAPVIVGLNMGEESTMGIWLMFFTYKKTLLLQSGR